MATVHFRVKLQQQEFFQKRKDLIDPPKERFLYVTPLMRENSKLAFSLLTALKQIVVSFAREELVDRKWKPATCSRKDSFLLDSLE